MQNNKDLIEIVKIDGLDVAIERHKGNCKVNLTNMAKRFGKQPIHWLRTREAQEFLAALEMAARRRDSDVDNDESVLRISSTKPQGLIVTRQGGSAKEQGTWCTDYRIAIRFAMWFGPLFAVFVIETFIKVINGEFILDEEGCISTADGRKWVTRDTYCKELGRSPSSFAGLKAHYPHHFEFVNGQHVMSREFFLYQSKKDNFEEERISFKLPVEDKRQLALPFAEYEEITEG